jgi:hypothetical protein
MTVFALHSHRRWIINPIIEEPEQPELFSTTHDLSHEAAGHHPLSPQSHPQDIQQSNVIEDILAKIDTPEERQEVNENVSRQVNANMLMLLQETAVQTGDLTARLEALINTPYNELTEEQLVVKEMLIYFLYLTKNTNV